MQEKAMKEKEQKAKEYEQYVKQVTPTHSLPMNMAKAFFVGGLICVIGQAILNVAGSYGLDQETDGDGQGTGGDLVYGSPDLRSSDHHGTGMVQYPGPDRRSGRSGADYRVCEFCRGICD